MCEINKTVDFINRISIFNKINSPYGINKVIIHVFIYSTVNWAFYNDYSLILPNVALT